MNGMSSLYNGNVSHIQFVENQTASCRSVQANTCLVSQLQKLGACEATSKAHAVKRQERRNQSNRSPRRRTMHQLI